MNRTETIFFLEILRIRTVVRGTDYCLTKDPSGDTCIAKMGIKGYQMYKQPRELVWMMRLRIKRRNRCRIAASDATHLVQQEVL